MDFCLLRQGTSISEFYNDDRHRRHAHISKEDADLLLEFELVQRVSLKLERVLQWKRFPFRAGPSESRSPIGEAIEMVLSNKARWGNTQMDRKFIGAMLTLLEHVREREPQSSRTGPRQLGALRQRDKMKTFIPGCIQKPKKPKEVVSNV